MTTPARVASRRLGMAVLYASYAGWLPMVNDVTALPSAASEPVTEGASTPRPLIASVQWQNIWTALGGIAGAGGIVYGIGAGIEALRLHAAGLPVEQAISVVPHTAMLTLAINRLLLPAAIFAAVSAGAIFLVGQKYTERLRDPKVVAKMMAEEEERKRRRLERAANAGWLGRQARRFLLPVWNGTLEHLPLWVRALLPAAIVVFLVAPVTAREVISLGAVAIQFNVIGHIAKHRVLRTISRRREAVLMGLVAAFTLSVQTLGGEVVNPGPLPRAAVKVAGQKREIHGDYVASTPEGIYLGVHRKLVLIPERLVDQTSVWNAPEQKPEKGTRLLGQL